MGNVVVRSSKLKPSATPPPASPKFSGMDRSKSRRETMLENRVHDLDSERSVLKLHKNIQIMEIEEKAAKWDTLESKYVLTIKEKDDEIAILRLRLAESETERGSVGSSREY